MPFEVKKVADVFGQMKDKRIYFDNAATSYPKPDAVLRAVEEQLKSCGNPGRGAHHFALAGARTLFEARENIAAYLGIQQTERLIFTPGCTASVNMALQGLAGQGFFSKGDLVLTSSIEHNAVMRPLDGLKRTVGIEVEMVAGKARDFVPALREHVQRKRPKLVVLTAASNLTGEVNRVDLASEFLASEGVPLVVDAAQTAGKWHKPLNETPGISFWCASGHKGLMGPPGVGLLYLAPGFDLSPLIFGGTGSRSDSFEMPASYPDRLEAGTPPGPAIAGLAGGVKWLRESEPGSVLVFELHLTELFIAQASGISKVKLYGPSDCFEGVVTVPSKFEKAMETMIPTRMPVVAFSVQGKSSAEVADLLDTEYGIAVRAGLHCAAAAHSSLGTLEEGLVRASFGFFNTASEVDSLCRALEKIAG
jgi:Selenocysteine lyase